MYIYIYIYIIYNQNPKEILEDLTIQDQVMSYFEIFY